MCGDREREIERERYREREIERERDRERDRERGRGRDPRCVVLLALDSFDIWPYIQHTVIYVLRRFTPAAIHFGVRSLRFTICRGDGWWLAEVRHQPRQDVPGDVAVLFNSKEWHCEGNRWEPSFFGSQQERMGFEACLFTYCLSYTTRTYWDILGHLYYSV